MFGGSEIRNLVLTRNNNSIHSFINSLIHSALTECSVSGTGKSAMNRTAFMELRVVCGAEYCELGAVQQGSDRSV